MKPILRPGQPDYPKCRIRLDIRSNTDPKFRKPIQSGRVRFGPKADPAQPVDTPSRYYTVPEYTGRFGQKREIWLVQKLKGKIEEMHDLNKP